MLQLAITTTVLPMLAVAGDGSHAARHPAGADVFFEVPAIDRLPAAYSSVALLRLFDDPALRESLSPVLDESGFDDAIPSTAEELEGVLSDLLSQTELEPQVASALAAAMTDARAVSMSLSGLGSGLLERAGAAGDTASAIRDLRELSNLIELHGDGAGASLPSSLGELADAPDTLLLDPWGGAYKYELLAEGGQFRLWTLGSDGEPGGSGAAADIHASDDEETVMAATLLDGLLVRLVADFESADSVSSVVDLLVSAGAQPATGLRGEADRAGWTWREPSWPGISLAIERGETDLVVDVSSQDPSLPYRAGEPANTWLGRLDETAGWKAGSSHLASTDNSAATAWQLFAAVAPGEILELLEVADLAVDVAPLVQLGIEVLGGSRRGMRCRTRIEDDGRFVTETFSQTTADGGPDRWFASEPIDSKLLSWIPDTAAGVFVTSFDAAYVFDRAVRAAALAYTGQDEPESVLSLVESLVGVRLDEELVDALGHGVVASIDLAGLGPPKIRVQVELEDPETFQIALSELADTITETVPEDQLRIRQKTYRGVELFTLSFPTAPELAVLSPTLCVLEGRLLFTISSSHARKEVKAIVKGTAGYGNHPIATGAAPDARALTYFDWGGIIGGVYELGRTFGGMFAGDQLPIDLASLPDEAHIASFFEPTRGSWRAVDGGFLCQSHSSIGPELILGPAFLAAWLTVAEEAVEPAPAPTPVEVEPGDESQSPSAEHEATAAALTRVRTAIAVYKLQNDSLPPSLAALVEPSDAFPQGYLNGEPVPADGWGRALIYALDANGYRLYSLGPDGQDQNASGDDVLPSKRR